MSLSDAFVAAGAALSGSASEADIQLRDAWERGERAHPGLGVQPEAFAAFLGERAKNISDARELAHEDLYLACACARGVSAALEIFETRFGPEISLALTKVPDALPMADELRQTIFADLLLPDATGKRGISSYQGRGGLFSWLRVIAVRRAFRELSKQKRETPLGDEQILASLQAPTDLGYMQEVYRDAFRNAFGLALAKLDDQERVVLRHHYVHGLSIDKLALLHKIHRATAARRIAKARESLLTHTRRHLLRDLRVTSEELDSIMRLIASNLDASIGGLMSSSDAS